MAESVASGRSVAVDDCYVAAALVGSEHVATLVLHGLAGPLALAERRTLERGALVTSLVLLFARTVAADRGAAGRRAAQDLLEGGAPTSRCASAPGVSSVVIDPPLMVAVASVEGLDRYTAVRAAARVAAGQRGLAGEHHGAVVALVASDEPLAVGRRLQDAIAQAGGTATVGVALADRESLRRRTTRRAAASHRC